MMRPWNTKGTQTSDRIPSFRATGLLKNGVLSVSSMKKISPACSTCSVSPPGVTSQRSFLTKSAVSPEWTCRLSSLLAS